MMSIKQSAHLLRLTERYPELVSCQSAIYEAYTCMAQAFEQQGKLLVCGNGGSASDAEHIVGELMKGFMKSRPVPEAFAQQLLAQQGEEGRTLAAQLQGALPAISLVSQTALQTAFANDVAADLAFAQQVYGYGQRGDVLLGISTSGHSANVIKAVQVAKAKGMHTIGMTGQGGGRLAEQCDIVIKVPWTSTPDIQERHLPVYHALCLMLEDHFFLS